MNRFDPKRRGQAGFIVSMELLLISTILVIGLIVGMVSLRDAMLAELVDTGEAIGALNQTYTFPAVADQNGAFTSGSTFEDEYDNGDLGAGIVDVHSGDANAELNWSPAADFNEGLVTVP